MKLDELSEITTMQLVPYHAFGSVDRPASIMSRSHHRIFLMNPLDGSIIVKELNDGGHATYYNNNQFRPEHGLGAVRD